ncbi:hypothetical protein [Actinoplanes sp. NPDC048796]|uniref:hypothetical protein n=1 Tax=Actinoplanes sp. NPDC048796 TaxID=3155640 RepID=UPI0033F4CDAE
MVGERHGGLGADTLPGMLRVAGIHGIFNLDRRRGPVEAADNLALAWGSALGRQVDVKVAYYADCLAAEAVQGAGTAYSPAEAQAQLSEWALALGAPAEVAQGRLTVPVRQIITWISRTYGLDHDLVERFVGQFLREVPAYLTDGGSARRAAQDRLAAVLREHRPRAVIAHSLGSVVAFETLCRFSEYEVDLFVTLGSPLGLPGVIFERLEPKGVRRPPGVRRWVDIADVGDIVAAPPRLGERFDVDIHMDARIGRFDFHRAKSYLAAEATRTEIAKLAAEA